MSSDLKQTSATTESFIAAEALLHRFFPRSIYPSATDISCIGERQIFGDVEGIFGVSKSACKHHHPQAFVRYPVGSKISSGMLRLTCPLLVKAIDEWEAEGAIPKLNTILRQNSSIQNDFRTTNSIWSQIKLESTTEEQKNYVVQNKGKAEAAHIFGSGIIGVTADRVDDIKCVHAHVADYLLRGGTVYF